MALDNIQNNWKIGKLENLQIAQEKIKENKYYNIKYLRSSLIIHKKI